MGKSRKLVDLELKEISGVDHPATLTEGWLVMKSSDDPLEAELADTIEASTTPDPHQEAHKMSDYTDESPVEAEVVAEEPSEDFRKELDGLQKALDAARAETEQVRAERELEKATHKAHTWAILPELVPAEFAPVLRSIRDHSPEDADAVEAILDGCAVALGEAGILKELGTDTSSGVDDAYGQIHAMAQSKVEAGRTDSIEKAIGEVAVENPDLYARYVSELGA